MAKKGAGFDRTYSLDYLAFIHVFVKIYDGRVLFFGEVWHLSLDDFLLFVR